MNTKVSNMPKTCIIYRIFTVYRRNNTKALTTQISIYSSFLFLFEDHTYFTDWKLKLAEYFKKSFMGLYNTRIPMPKDLMPNLIYISFHRAAHCDLSVTLRDHIHLTLIHVSAKVLPKMN